MRARVRDPLSRVWRFFDGHDRAWLAVAGFTRRDVVTPDGGEWVIYYKVHVVRSVGARAVELKSSVTIWPPTARARAEKWRRACQREIRRDGYRGGWMKSPHGRFGDFWKTLASARAVPAEVKRLDRLRARVIALSARRADSRPRGAGRAACP
jgi:hypothetical protein